MRRSNMKLFAPSASELRSDEIPTGGGSSRPNHHRPINPAARVRRWRSARIRAWGLEDGRDDEGREEEAATPSTGVSGGGRVKELENGRWMSWGPDSIVLPDVSQSAE
jgi:hypothetical protein